MGSDLAHHYDSSLATMGSDLAPFFLPVPPSYEHRNDSDTHPNASEGLASNLCIGVMDVRRDVTIARALV